MIRCESLRFAYAGAAVLDGFDLEVGDGEQVAVLGRSGEGKTTLLRLIAGLEAPAAGRILLDGEVASGDGRMTAPHLRSVGYAFQEPALWPHVSVAGHQTFGMGRRARAESLAWRSALLDGFGLTDLADRVPGELSGGQQHRVGLARAFARRPKRLLLDEPLVHLDAEAREELARVTLRFAAELGASVVWVTHHEDEARLAAPRVVRLEHGRCVE
jgi:iron(III) transport system ATP-binding protein